MAISVQLCSRHICIFSRICDIIPSKYAYLRYQQSNKVVRYMQRKKHNKAINKKRLIRVIALACAICFFAVFLLSSTLMIAHAMHDHEPVSICQRTLLPECNCVIPLASGPTLIETHESSEPHLDCTVCLIVHKAIDQLRQQLLVVNGAVHTNISILITTMLGLLFLLSGTGTPVMLKTRSDN